MPLGGVYVNFLTQEEIDRIPRPTGRKFGNGWRKSRLGGTRRTFPHDKNVKPAG
jgi:hypothetical protein